MSAINNRFPKGARQWASTGTLQNNIALSWCSVDNARADYLHPMSTQGNDIILWCSSENGDSGMGLFDYLSNTTIERWTKERVLLHSSVNQCNIPKGILAGQGKAAGGMGGDAGRNNAASPKEGQAQPAQAPNPINLLRGLFGK